MDEAIPVLDYDLERFIKLANTFPGLAGKGITCVNDLMSIANRRGESRCTCSAARFMISVFDPYGLNQVGHFNLWEAWHAWDGAHRAAYQAWVAAGPFWV